MSLVDVDLAARYDRIHSSTKAKLECIAAGQTCLPSSPNAAMCRMTMKAACSDRNLDSFIHRKDVTSEVKTWGDCFLMSMMMDEVRVLGRKHGHFPKRASC